MSSSQTSKEVTLPLALQSTFSVFVGTVGELFNVSAYFISNSKIQVVSSLAGKRIRFLVMSP